MINSYAVVFRQTFKGATLLRVVPKTEKSDRNNPNSPMVPAYDKDGVPKYTAYLSVETQPFDKPQFDNITCTISSRDRLDEEFTEKVDVVLDGFKVNVMKSDKGGGYTFYFTADAIIPLKAAQFAKPGQQTHMASAQQQPARVAASGQ
jgi:hypothetical protein